MMKAGLIEEMMDDVMDSVNDTQEEEVDEEVEKVLLEVAGEEIAELPDAGRTKVEPEQTEEVRTPIAPHVLPSTPVSGYVSNKSSRAGSHYAAVLAAEATGARNVASACSRSDARGSPSSIVRVMHKTPQRHCSF